RTRAVVVAVDGVSRHRADRGSVDAAGEVLPGLLGHGRARLAAVDAHRLEVVGHAAGRGLRRRGTGVVAVGGDLAAVVGQVLVVAGLAVEQVGVALVVAGHRRRLRLQDDTALAVVLGEADPLLARAGVLEDAEHGLTGGVGVDDVLVAIGQGLHRLYRPGVVARGVAAGGVAEGEVADAAGAGRAALALDRLPVDPPGAVVLVIAVRVVVHLAVRQRVDVAAQL